jgi:hypothetical protein
VIKQVRDLARAAKPGAENLNKLLTSLDQDKVCVIESTDGTCTRDTTGYQGLMDFLFNTSAAVNGFDEYGHYLRTFGLVTNCTLILTREIGECNAKFDDADTTTTSASAALLKDRFDRNGGRNGGRGDDAPSNGTVEPQPQPQPAPTPTPDEGGETAPPDQGEPGEVTPFSEAATSRRSTRAGRALLRFLVGDS